VFNVKAFGAVGDGKTDDTASFKNSLKAAEDKGTGSVVFIPSGRYLIEGTLDIPGGLTLEGTWKIPNCDARDMSGSTLLTTHGKGDENGAPFITLHHNSTIKGLTIFHPEQNGESVVPYPWTIATGGAANCSIIDVMLINPYQGVDLGSKRSGRHYIRNLYGQPLRKGIFIDQCYDVGRIENVHFWPFWTHARDDKKGAAQFMAQQGEAFILGRTDWQYMFNTFVLGYNVGYRFFPSEHGFANGNFLGIGADVCNISLKVDACSQHGILITNGEFVSFIGDTPTDIVITSENNGTIQFQNCDFWGPADRVAAVDGNGMVMFNNCNFVFPDKQDTDLPAIEVSGGNIIITSCNFLNPAFHIKLNEGVKSAIISSNRFRRRPVIVNESKGDVQIGLNVTS
jgi:hypothetical protein